MSYDISIVNEKNEAVHIPEKHDIHGPNYCLGGTTELWMNITYNYSPIFRKLFGKDGINVIEGKDIFETIPVLDKAVRELGDATPNEDYWASTEGNVKLALLKLKTLADLALIYFPKEKMVWKIC